MTFARFLDCAYALLFEEYQRLGMDIVTVRDRLEEWRRERVEITEEPQSQAVTAQENERSLAQLQAAMAGVGGMPG